jgi:hypothetical protein
MQHRVSYLLAARTLRPDCPQVQVHGWLMPSMLLQCGKSCTERNPRSPVRDPGHQPWQRPLATLPA